MNNTEAKFILNAYRPGGRDASDAMFGAALAQAKADPALGAWFARSQAHDAAVAAGLRAIAAPAGLREAILAGARVSGENSAPAPARRAIWARPAWLAAAAAVAVLVTAGITFWVANSDAKASELASFALDDMVHGRHGGHGPGSAQLQRWAASADTHFASATMPLDFATLEQTGCRTLAFEGHQALEVCFQRGGPEFHLYIIRHEDMPGRPARAAPAMIAQASGAAAVWSDARFHYALVSDAGEQAIKRLL